MSTEILMRYKRVGESYQGEFQVDGHVVDLFEGISFAQHIRLLHLLLVKHEGATVQMQRTDREGLMPIFMERDMVLMVRDDPTRYIQAHTLPHRVVDMRKKDERTSKLAEKHVVPKTTTVRAGHDTLKDAFGDVVYLRLRSGSVEDPVTGRFRIWHEISSQYGLPSAEVVLIPPPGNGWVTVRTADLLAVSSHVKGFFLPRAWNERGPWISREALSEKYNQYLKGKASCLDQTKAL